MQFKDKLFGYKWENTSPTIQLMGRFNHGITDIENYSKSAY